MTTGDSGPHLRDYFVFGLRVRSSIELPELIEAGGEGEPDVVIECEPVAELANGDDPTLVLSIPDVGSYRVENGRRIVIDALSGVPEANVRLFLLGSVFGALMHQRGLLPLHANAIAIDGKAVAFMGASGEGKSMLAAWFHDRGYPVVADDVCVVRLDEDGRAIAAPGVQRLRLWKEALQAMGRDSSVYARSFAGRDEIEKYDLPFEPDQRVADPYELAAIYVLGTADSFSIKLLSGLEATEAVFSHTYRGHYVSDAGVQKQHWQSAVELVRRTPVFRVRRPRDLSLMNEQGRQLIEHVRSITSSER